MHPLADADVQPITLPQHSHARQQKMELEHPLGAPLATTIIQSCPQTATPLLTTAMYKQKKTEMKRPLGAVSRVCGGVKEQAQQGVGSSA